MKVFVTGAEGFIGSHLVESLVRDGHAVKALYLYNFADEKGWLEDLAPDVRNEVECVSGDIRDAAFLRNAMSGCSSVFHLAALIGIPYSYQAPESYVQTNIVGSLNVFQAALDLGLERVIHTSTSEVYGTAQSVPMDEQHRLLGQSPYSASKIGADQMAHAFWASFGLPVTIVRPFNTFGPRQSTRAVIPNIVLQLLDSPDGSLSLGDLSTTRDFTHVTDTVAGFRAASMASGALGEMINLGTGLEISISELVQMVGDILGLVPEVSSERQRMRPAKSEVRRLVSDPSKASRLLNWSAECNTPSAFRKALSNTVSWYSDQKNRAKFSGKFVV